MIESRAAGFRSKINMVGFRLKINMGKVGIWYPINIYLSIILWYVWASFPYIKIKK
jgi:hypothetical protein